jgi:hypothetical protein
MADTLEATVRQLYAHPLLSGATYDTAKFRQAKAAAQSTLNRLASTIGVTTLSKENVQQLLLGGLGRIQAAARTLRVTSKINAPAARAYEARLLAKVQRLASSLGALASSARVGSESTSGLGILPLLILVVGVALLADYLGLLDDTDEVLQEYEAICTDPSMTPEQRISCYEAIRDKRREESESDPFGMKQITGAVGTVIKVVVIGGAVLGVGYLLWTFGPALAGAGRKVRSAAKRKYA